MKSFTLLKNKPFLLIWISEIFGVLGFSMFLITLSWYVVDQLHLSQNLGLVFAVSSVPRLFTMALGGVLADKVQKSQIMFVSGMVQTALLGILLFLFINGSLTFTSILIISFCSGFTDGIFYPALSSSIPNLVKKAELQSANTLIHSTQEFVFLIGPVIAGMLISYYSYAATFGVGMIAMFIHAITVHPAIIQDPKPNHSDKGIHFINEFREGLHYVFESPIYKTGISIVIVVNLFVFGPILLSFPIITKELSGTALQLSFLESGFSIGSLIATLFLLFVALQKKRGKWIFFFLFSSLLCLLIFSQVESLYILIFMGSLIAFSAFMVFLPTDVIIQERTDPAKMGRVMGIVFLSQTAFDPISQSIISFLMTAGYSIRTILSFSAVIGLLVSFLILFRAKAWRSLQ
ncbi:Predicted arabinose efflux permease, MFS family [Seinonella peptonophila]|uniref:Predicted arabinose efflux permease, MFS family n=1 Tax=Seinonella peptonophila TaxID=112248 RepID=A0A1M4U7G7_9BACL|nr:MFS transporter [Seinonella peptonophila]SHE52546.1 Predicted arabinose efflux permease, MFS family [Seinonella peptonophila]